MRALVWIVEDTWKATVAEADALLPHNTDVTLLHVAATEPETIARAARHGLLGRHPHPRRRPRAAAGDLRASRARAARRSQGPPGTNCQMRCAPRRVEREVVAAQWTWTSSFSPATAMTSGSDRAAWARDALRHRPRPLPRTAHLARGHTGADNNSPATTRRASLAPISAGPPLTEALETGCVPIAIRR